MTPQSDLAVKSCRAKQSALLLPTRCASALPASALKTELKLVQSLIASMDPAQYLNLCALPCLGAARLEVVYLSAWRLCRSCLPSLVSEVEPGRAPKSLAR